MKKTFLIGLFAFTSLYNINSFAHDGHDHSGAQMPEGEYTIASNVSHAGHTGTPAPAGIMGDHVHGEGEYMLSYSYSHMNMGGYLNGSDDVSAASILTDGYMMAATDMEMDMHMFGAMYGFTDDTTGMIMFDYMSKKMGMTDGMMDMNMDTSGLGDVKLTGITNVYESNDNGSTLGINVSYGASLPTGSINEAGMNAGSRADYGMQLGSGTFDPTFGATLYNRWDNYYLGLQTSVTPRFYDNSENYHKGTEAKLGGWASVGLTEGISASFRLDGKYWGDIEGRDTSISLMGMPGGDPDNTGGKRVDALVGLNIYETNSSNVTHKVQVEYGMPVYQDLNGPQMKVDNTASLVYKLTY